MSEKTMRDVVFEHLFQLAKADRNIVLVTADCGAPSLDRWRLEMPQQFVNVGIAEQNMISLAAGMALSGKKVYCYAIAPFVTLRCLEQIKVDLCVQNLPVTLIGVGAGFSYDVSGPTHHATEDIAVMRALPNMTLFCPADNPSAVGLAGLSLHTPGPVYIRLDRKQMPDLYPWNLKFEQGYERHFLSNKEQPWIVLVATGNMVHIALKVAEQIKDVLPISVIDLYRLKIVDIHFMEYLRTANPAYVVTLEEHNLSGGLGSIVSEVITENRLPVNLQRIGIPDRYLFTLGGREALQEKCRLDPDSVLEFLRKLPTEVTRLNV